MATRVCIAGSNRSRSRSWIDRHSATSRAATPRRIEALDDAQDILDARDGDAEPLGDVGNGLAEIAGIVDGIDQMPTDQPLDGVVNGEIELGAQVIVQGCLGCEAALEPVRPLLEGPAGAAIGAADDRQAVGPAALEPGHRRLLALEDVVEAGAETVFHTLLAVQALGPLVALRVGRMRALGDMALEGPLGCVVALEQRIALEFTLDEILEFEMRQLQKLDRLQQLRRHHQGLALAQLHARHHRHALATFPLRTPETARFLLGGRA